MNAKAAKKTGKRRGTKKKDIVLGLGSTGLSIARFLARNDGDAIFVDSRESPPGIEELADIFPDAEVVTGDMPTRLLKNAGRVIASPGIADSEAFLVAARKSNVDVVSDIELFVAEADAPMVAVTGSNGKSTVTTLLALMCEAAGRRGLAGANLGVPALDLLMEDTPDFYLLELSSFQLQRTRTLPLRIAVLLNISPDHLDWHASEAEYREAKYRIFAQAEHAVYNRADEDVRDRLPADGEKRAFGLDEPGEDEYGLREEGGDRFLARGEKLLLSVRDVAMVGTHNYVNGLAALAAGELMGLDLSPMLQVLNEFPGLPHRMQAVGRIGGVLFINDSKATNVGASIAAVESIAGMVVLIAGGQGKGGDFDRLASSTCSRLRAVVLIGEDADQLAEAFEGLTAIKHAADMREAIDRAAKLATNGDTVLLAPACASFDQFANYQARGEEFTQLVEAMAA